MKFSEFVGQGSEIEHLMRSVKAGRIVHAYLFVGAAGSGKKTLASLIAQSLFCTAGDKPCGACPACKRFQGGNHPDVRAIAPKGKSIGVDEVRALIGYLSTKPYEGGYRAVIVENADKMTASAQNALLKTLEGPGDGTVFFLLSESPAALLSTVRSRLRTVRIAPLSKELCARALVEKGVDEHRAEKLSGFARGSVGRALEIDKDDGYFPLFDRVAESLQRLRGPGSVSAAVSLLSEEKERVSDVVEMLEILARDKMAAENGADAEACGRAALDAISVSGSALLRGVALLRQMLFANVAWSSALDRLYFSIAEGRQIVGGT